MTSPRPFYTTHGVTNGTVEVRAQVGPTDTITVSIRPDLVGTDIGDEIIRQAIEAHAERKSIVRGEGS